MIISHKHKFVFFHCRKTAGTSISSYLNKFLGPDDIQIGSWLETRANGGTYNRRFLTDVLFDRQGRTFLENFGSSVIRGKLPQLHQIHRQIYRQKLGVMPAHALASEVKHFLGQKFDTYFKFCFVRDPFDRAYSDYKYRLAYKGVLEEDMSFLDFLNKTESPCYSAPEGVVTPRYDNWPVYTINDEIAVDFVGKYEHLTRDFKSICSTLQLSFNPDRFPHAKKSAEFKNDYRSKYGNKEREIVERLFAKEIDQFGYSF